MCHSFFKSIHKLSISICSTLLRHLSPTYEMTSTNFKHIVRTGPRPSPTQKAASSDRCCILVLIMCCLTQKFTVPTFLSRCTGVCALRAFVVFLSSLPPSVRPSVRSWMAMFAPSSLSRSRRPGPGDLSCAPLVPDILGDKGDKRRKESKSGLLSVTSSISSR